MSNYVRASARLRAICILALVSSVTAHVFPVTAFAQTAPEVLPELVITPTRSPEDPQRIGSAISVIEGREIAAWGSPSMADVLRRTPGLDVTENGGPGGLSYVRLRGAESRQTLVLIDNIRTGDAASTDGATDFSNISPDEIERIEILRGPQSALYGSDAMGGVINIITKKGARTPRTALIVEGGSFGTVSTRLATSGATDRTTWTLSVSGLHSDGFSRYAYRIGRLTSALATPLENDKTDRISGSARITHRLAETAEIDIGLRSVNTKAAVDNPGAFASPRDNRFDKSRQTLTTLYGKVSADALDGRLRNSLTIFTSLTDRLNRGAENCYDAPTFTTIACDAFFRSRRYGAEYQGDLDLGQIGKTTLGAKAELEEASNREIWLFPISANMPGFNGSQRTNSIFALHQLPLGPLSLSLGGRVDSVDGKSFPTWRATAAYNIIETGTKFRASAGTGAKAASLYQRFSIYGTPGLLPEYNFGYDAGIDQSLLDGRVKLSLTAFDTRYRDLFDFDFTANNFAGAYINIGRARISGLEASADAIIVPDEWRLRASYTRLRAVDLMRQQPLLRRPRDSVSLSALYSGIANLEIEGRLTFVGNRIDVQNDFPYSRVQMAPYGKADIRASYKVNDQLSIFARMENITDARYQEIRDYGTAGRSYYAGMQVTW